MEKYDVKLSKRAINDLDEIYLYIKNTLIEPKVAEELITELEKSILSLDTLPHRCPQRMMGIYAGKGYR